MLGAAGARFGHPSRRKRLFDKSCENLRPERAVIPGFGNASGMFFFCNSSGCGTVVRWRALFFSPVWLWAENVLRWSTVGDRAMLSEHHPKI